MALPPLPRFDYSQFVEGKYCMHFKSLFACETPLLKGANLCVFLRQMDQREYEVITQENAELIAERAAQRSADQKEVEKSQFYLSIAKYTMLALGGLTFAGTIYYSLKARVARVNRLATDKAWNAYNKEHDRDKLIEDCQRGVEGAQEKHKHFVDTRLALFGSPGELATLLEKYETIAGRLRNSSIGLFMAAAGLNLTQWAAALLPNLKDTKDLKDREICRNRQLRILDKIRCIENRIRAIHDGAEIEQLTRAKDYFNTFWNLNSENAAVVRHEHHTVVHHENRYKN